MKINIFGLILLFCICLYSCFFFPMNQLEYDLFNVEETRITASDGSSDDHFGFSVSISEDGSTFVVGAEGDDDNGYDSGSVYVYKWNDSNWVETKIIASDGSSDDYFGKSVSISEDGSIFVVGADRDNNDGSYAGSVYVYIWYDSNWVETKIIASDGSWYDKFGYSVSISGDGNTFIVGAPEDDDNGDYSGSVYVYKWNGSSWDESKTIASDGLSDDYFGTRVSISGDGNSFIVGAEGDDDNGRTSGSIYIYKWNDSSWDETKIVASDGSESDHFGFSVSISEDGSTFVVGAESDDDNGSYSGSVYVYKWNGSIWDELKIIASDGSSYDSFGMSVAMAGEENLFIVGAPGVNALGSAYLFSWNGTKWEEGEIGPNYNSDNFGRSVSITRDGKTFIVGSPDDDGMTGSVTLYKW